jgi:hypothetical protein
LAEVELNLDSDDSPGQLNAASIRYRIAAGPGSGGRPLTLRIPDLLRADPAPKPFTANQDGFSVNCAV